MDDGQKPEDDEKQEEVPPLAPDEPRTPENVEDAAEVAQDIPDSGDPALEEPAMPPSAYEEQGDAQDEDLTGQPEIETPEETLPPPPEDDERVVKRTNIRDQETLKNIAGEGSEFDNMFDEGAGTGGSAGKKKGKKGKKKPKKKVNYLKKYKNLLIFLGFVGLIGYGYYYLSQPRIGTVAYGVCKVFLERSVQYPTSLRVSTVKTFNRSVRIWYVQTDSFGQYRMEPIQCYYKAGNGYAFLFEKITINRREVDQQLVEDFNKIIPSLRFTEDYLIIPPPLPNKVRRLQVDVFKGFSTKHM